MLHSLQMQERRGRKKNPKSIQPGDFLPRSSCLPQLITIPHKTKPPPTQQNETSKQASKQCAQKGFQVVTATLPAGDYSSAPPNKSSGNLSGMSYPFLYL